jgi:hypothetical protein
MGRCAGVMGHQAYRHPRLSDTDTRWVPVSVAWATTPIGMGLLKQAVTCVNQNIEQCKFRSKFLRKSSFQANYPATKLTMHIIEPWPYLGYNSSLQLSV